MELTTDEGIAHHHGWFCGEHHHRNSGVLVAPHSVWEAMLQNRPDYFRLRCSKMSMAAATAAAE
jgi:hypothetical protein